MKFPAAALIATLLLVQKASAITIVLDYSHDVATDNFFNTHPAAKAALEKARDDIQAAITSMPAAMVDTTSGTVNATTATYNFSLSYTNPSAGGTVSLSDSAMPSGEVRFFVGMRELTGTTLGQGGPGSYGLGITGGGNPADWPAAVNAANVAATAARLRGTGPTINTLNTTVNLGGVDGNVQVSLGSALANLWFDIDTDNNGLADSDPVLNTNWHFDHTTPVGAGKSDFYTTSLHEIIHGLGFGTSQTWTGQVSGTDWTGSNVISLLGSGTGVLAAGGTHIASGLTSPRLSDGVMQETVLAPSITVGTRKTLTELDLAFLRDLNWNTVPEPSAAAMTLMVLGGALLRRRK